MPRDSASLIDFIVIVLSVKSLALRLEKRGLIGGRVEKKGRNEEPI